MARRSPYKLKLMNTDRLRRGWSYSDLADEVGVHVSTVTRFFKGSLQAPGTAKKIALGLGYPLDRYVRDDSDTVEVA